MEHLLTPDELELTINYNWDKLKAQREKGEGDGELAELFEHRMNESLSEYLSWMNSGRIAVEQVIDLSLNPPKQVPIKRKK